MSSSYAYSIKSNQIEQVPTNLHYLGEEKVFAFFNKSKSRVSLCGGRFYMSSDTLGTKMYHLRGDDGAIYAFDSLETYNFWLSMKDKLTYGTD